VAGRHPRDQGPDRRACRQPDEAGDGRDERHLQLYPDPDAEAGLPYEAVFEEARQLGYLEADPNLDVGGIDAGHKLSLLSAIAFGTRVSFDAVELEGIGNVSIDDIRLAEDMGYRIKLLGVAQMTGRGLEQRMTPCLVPADSPLGQLQGGTNMVVLEGDSVGQIVLRGPGRRHGPHRQRGHGRCDRHRPRLPPADLRHPAADAWYRRRPANRQPRPLLPADDAARQTRRAGQDRHLSGRGRRSPSTRCANTATGHRCPVLIVTHKAAPADVAHAMASFGRTGVLVGQPVAIRIEQI
jgi:homoserine dehydrogenase